MMKAGFSLLELSIVLVIIGLLAGGVMTGQSLIHAAELRSVITEYSRWVTATNAFRDKYQAIPGDLKMATAFWGKDNTNCPGDSGTASTPGACNGDGNGKVSFPSAAYSSGEAFQMWKQLALAGLIEGTYTGLSDYAFGQGSRVGSNIPQSKMTNGGWGMGKFSEYDQLWPGDTNNFTSNYANSLTFGKEHVGSPPGDQLLTPEDS